MPSAMSRPSEPVETVSTSIEWLFLPSFMIEPLPKLRSICESAASRAFDLSMDNPSTRRSAALIFRAPYGRDSQGRQSPENPTGNDEKTTVHDLFYVRNMFSKFSGTGPFPWSVFP